MHNDFDPHEQIPRRRSPRFAPGPMPTLDDLQRESRWVWVNCARHGCWHRSPMALAPLVIRWGFGVSSNQLRRSAVCTECGHRGASFTLPSAGPERNWYPFPISEMKVARSSGRGRRGSDFKWPHCRVG